MDNTVSNFWYAWKGRYLRTAATGGYYVYYNYEHPGAQAATVSEAHGYGMVLCASMAGADPLARTYVDGLYRYYTNHPSGIDSRLMAWQQDTSFNNIGGDDSATDGDLDIAYGLLLAHQQWGSTGTVNYFRAATNIIAGIMQSEVNQTQWTLRLGDWATSGTSHGFAYATATRPSDFMLDHLLAFYEATGDGRWTNLCNRTVSVINSIFTNNSPGTGLLSDFVVLSNSVYTPAPASFLENATDGQYAYNSCRTPWRFATDYILSGDAGPLAELRRMNGWIKSASVGDPTKVYPGYTLTGTATDTGYTDSSFTAPFGVCAMTDATNQTWLNSLWIWCANGGINANDGYFGNSIKLQSMLVMSGNWWRPEFMMADSDGDGLPDAWTRRYFWHPTGQGADASRAADDPDADGMSNAAEFRAGTNPTNAASNFRITSAKLDGPNVTVQWCAVGGKSYVVQSGVLAGGSWQLSNQSAVINIPGSGETIASYAYPGGATNAQRRFYRVRLSP